MGATASGPSRGTDTGTDGRLIYETRGISDYSPEGYPWICQTPAIGAPSSSTEQTDIDTVAWFSSYGPTTDNRIKPEVVATGNQVRAWLHVEPSSAHYVLVAFFVVMFVAVGTGGRAVTFVVMHRVS